MRRTIQMRNIDGLLVVFYGNRRVDYITRSLAAHFNLRASTTHKYIITIVEGTQYYFEDTFSGVDLDYNIFSKGMTNRYISIICKKHFDRIFFVPDYKKRYDITVKKVRI